MWLALSLSTLASGQATCSMGAAPPCWVPVAQSGHGVQVRDGTLMSYHTVWVQDRLLVFDVYAFECGVCLLL